MMEIVYLGQCGFLLEGDGTRLLTDPYLTDYLDKNLSKTIPWQRRYAPPVEPGQARANGVLISHAHEDHMDPWTLAALPDRARMVCAAPAPECGRLTGYGFGAVAEAEAERPFTIGKARVTPIACAHTELRRDAAGRHWALSYLIELDGVRVFFGGDMSLYPGLEARVRAARPDVLLLPANGRDDERTRLGIVGNVTCAEAARFAAAMPDAAYVPMHWDLYEVNGETEQNIRASACRAGAKLCLLRPGERMTARASETEGKNVAICENP